MTVLKVENLSKQYRLGEVGTGTLSHDLNRWWHKVRGKEDPYLKIGDVNDRSKKSDSEYAWALKDINFEVKQGEVLGIIGKNGAGKSTLLKILSKVTSPTTGSIKVKGRIASLLEVGTGFHPELTGRENIYLNGAILGMTKAEIKSKLDEIVDFSGCEKYIDTPTKRYSSGMTVRLGFAVAAHLEPEILIVDEVLAVGDQDFQDKCIGKMKQVSEGGRTVLFVSHNMDSILRLCGTGILLSKGSIEEKSSITEIVNGYLQKVRNNEKFYESGVVKKVSAVTSNDNINIELEYDTHKHLYLPNFGFIVTDSFGNIIFGTNAKKEGYKLSDNYPSKGKLNVVIDNSRLNNGVFYLSIWFGDGYIDFFEDKQAICFEIIRDRKSNIKSETPGYINVDAKFYFN
ncbi:MAG: ABC transporter ATP-binding protein [Luteibaculaceae bacterium]